MRNLTNAAFTVILFLSSAPTFAGIVDRLNAVRSQGCSGKAGIDSPLRTSRDLNKAAHEWSKGTRLSAALERVEYRANRSVSMRVSGPENEDALVDLMKQRYCAAIVDEALQEIGLFKRDNAVWVVLAAPFVLPGKKDAGAVRETILALVNEARSKPRKCGQTSFKAAPPLKLSAKLNRAALIHSKDMSQANFFEHVGSDRSTVADRVTRVSYRWRTVGENIASGAENSDVVVRGWLDSPGHCSNIMGAQFTEMGVAYVTNTKNSAGIYWTQVFATPR